MPAGLERIVFFGDSFSDGGGLFDLTTQVLSVSPLVEAGYGAGFTNGTVYADVLPVLLGVSTSNYAIADARAIYDAINAD